jgi:AGZA family xanthine/uracil permease-like MFS transporter
MTYSAGIGVVTGAVSTPLELAGCVADEMVDGVCPGSTKMRSPTMWIGIFCGGFLTAILLAYKVKGAIIAGILLVSIISWPRPTSVTYFPYTAVGNDNFDFFKKVVTFHGIEKTLAVQDWNVAGVTGQFGLAFITFLYVDILDCTGTLYSMARFSGAIDEETQDFEGSAVAYLVDGNSRSLSSVILTDALQHLVSPLVLCLVSLQSPHSSNRVLVSLKVERPELPPWSRESASSSPSFSPPFSPQFLHGQLAAPS